MGEAVVVAKMLDADQSLPVRTATGEAELRVSFTPGVDRLASVAQPQNFAVGDPLGVTVELLDADGGRVINDDTPVVLALGDHPSNGELLGTLVVNPVVVGNLRGCRRQSYRNRVHRGRLAQRSGAAAGRGTESSGAASPTGAGARGRSDDFGIV